MSKENIYPPFAKRTPVRNAFNKMVSSYLEMRYQRILDYMENPISTQKRVFDYLIYMGKDTEFGELYNFESIQNRKEFAQRVPLHEYDDLKKYISIMMYGEEDILWPGQVKWFSKSSGTTSDKSKFIPVSRESLRKSHIKGSWDVVTLLYHDKPESRIFADKSLVMGGSVTPFDAHPSTMFGDISGIMLENMPSIGRPFYSPDFETALMSDWEKKIERMAHICMHENISMFGGVPTWTIVLFRRMLEISGKANMLEIWPNVQVYVHGGVGFGPYKKYFKELLPSDSFSYLEVYNASEGYFAIQNDLKSDDLLLLLDNGAYYEFLPMDSYGQSDAETLLLEEVELDRNYALVISTNSGLWRYMTGDTIKFTSLKPFKIKITGRTKHFINVFGEEVMVSNTDRALARTCEDHDAVVSEYTVGPVFFEDEGKGGHEWMVEFAKEPFDLENFALDLDKNLQNVNSDYEAKRYGNMALDPLKLNKMPEGTFVKWMKYKGKLGGQNKVPRLSNTRKYIDEIESFLKLEL